MPAKHEQISFKNYTKQMKIPFIIYVHFDALKVPKSRSKTLVHKPCGFGYSVKCSYDPSLSKYEDFCGEDSANVLWEKLEIEACDISEKLKSRVEPQVLNEEQKEQMEKIKHCYFCGEELNGDRCEDFHPLSGDFLGVAHRHCKDQSKLPNFIPVVMHNLVKYGAHFLLKDLSPEVWSGIGGNREAKYGFTRRFGNNLQLRFIDSHLFMDEKIEDLEKILRDSKKHSVKRWFKEEAEFELMKTKSYFPHHHMDCFEKFSERSLPTKEGFYDQLHDHHISHEDYQKTLTIWETFRCRTIGDYFSLYLKSNVLLLQDIFENFRSLCLDKYHLDPAHYYTVASFAWDTMLKYTKAKYDMLQDSNMIEFIRSNIRGGITQCSKRHAKANNIYCPTYDDNEATTFIINFDANNLAGWAMSHRLPLSDFRWLNEAETRTIEQELGHLNEDHDYGYIFEVDLEYPSNLHEAHNDLPFCSERIIVPSLSSFVNPIPVLNFYKKKNYVIDYRYLQQCISSGLVLKKIYRVLRFKQSKWMEPYITYNTELRASARNDFETKLYKLLNNSVYGKTIQKTSNDKPIYAGFCILELSKKFIYDFHYEKMLRKYPGKINLLYMDTDSLIYEVETNNIFEDFKSDSDFLELLDTSTIDSRWGIPSKNKKMLGKMKDERGGKIIREFYGVGAKVYCLDVEGEDVKKAVGVKTYVKEKHISKSDYENCVMNNSKIRRSLYVTDADNHEVLSRRITKVVLSPGDNKRCILSDKVNTRAWGYQS